MCGAIAEAAQKQINRATSDGAVNPNIAKRAEVIASHPESATMSEADIVQEVIMEDLLLPELLEDEKEAIMCA